MYQPGELMFSNTSTVVAGSFTLQDIMPTYPGVVNILNDLVDDVGVPT
jgi:hypothetical protein